MNNGSSFEDETPAETGDSFRTDRQKPPSVSAGQLIGQRRAAGRWLCHSKGTSQRSFPPPHRDQSPLRTHFLSRPGSNAPDAKPDSTRDRNAVLPSLHQRCPHSPRASFATDAARSVGRVALVQSPPSRLPRPFIGRSGFVVPNSRKRRCGFRGRGSFGGLTRGSRMR